MYYVVTGAAGFVGSNIIRALNARGETRIIAVDNLTRADKFHNLSDCSISDYLDKNEFLNLIRSDSFPAAIDAILHQGACSDTLESNGHYMMENNYRYSVSMLDYCVERDIPLIYASSAAVYGSGQVFREDPACERPLNIYGYSKLLFDQHVRYRRSEFSAQVVGLRYFNVYGPRERHKGKMASVALHCFEQYRAHGKVKLFEGGGGYAPGEQRRDFVSVQDVVKANLFFLDHPDLSGVFNVGTGISQTFNEVAVAAVNAARAKGNASQTLDQLREAGVIEYIPFPPALLGKYQSYTQADISALRQIGYTAPFLTVQQGVASYIESLLAQQGSIST